MASPKTSTTTPTTTTTKKLLPLSLERPSVQRAKTEAVETWDGGGEAEEDGCDCEMPMDDFAARISEAIIDVDQNSYVCEAMEGVSISSPSLTPKMRNKGSSPPLSRPKKPIPPPLVLRDEHEDVDVSSSIFSNSMLTEFAIIATSPRSPLMQKHLPIRKRAYSFSSMESLHSYARLQPLTPPPGLLSPPSSHVSCSSLTSSTDEIQDRISPASTPGALDVHQTAAAAAAAASSSTSAYRWPIAVWQCFLKGVRVQILGHNNGGCDQIQSWLLVDEISREADFQNFDLSQYAPNGLRLLDACPTTAAASTLLQLRFEPVDPVPQPQPIVLVEFACDHPFFVKDKGWSSAQIELTARTYGIPCRTLQPSDICLPPSHSEATFTSNVYESVKSFDFTPEDTSAVFALSSMAKKQMQSAIVPAATMSPPISPVKKCLQATANGTTVLGVGSSTVAVELGGKAKRPMNGFMMFAKKYRVHYTHLHPGKDNRAISVLLGETWKRMSSEEKFVYSEEARINAAEYKKVHPDCWKRFKKQSS